MNWNTATMILEIAMVLIVIGLGALYVRTQGQFQRRFNIRKSVTRKLVRNVILAFIAGLIITLLENRPLYDGIVGGNTIGWSMLVSGHNLSGLVLILQNIFSSLGQSFPLAIFSTMSFVTISLFYILRTREGAKSAPRRLNNPPTVQ
jgi:hypothetical protein